jgi:maltooligosyltrehalose trehalohydrolase
MSMWKLSLGVEYLGRSKTAFRVWAPRVQKMSVRIIENTGNRDIPMEQEADGYFSCKVNNVPSGARYFYLLNGETERPDPVSRFQPEGVHGPSMVVDAAEFKWRDQNWKGIPLSKLIFYELHVGTFTPTGTLESAMERIPYLKQLGITAIELMPVAQCPGVRNWGYDGVSLFAVSHAYGGPAALKKFVQAAHAAGISVCLDVVYNHLGPEGNYLHDFGPYFTKKYRTPWGDAINYDGPDAKPVREFFIANALSWVCEFHIDSLRLDAVHGIFDSSSPHILQELNDRVKSEAKKLGRKVILIAESELNDPVLIRPKKKSGYGLDAQWSDDFHHAVHSVLTQEKRGYYADYGRLEDIAKAVKSSFVYDGKYSQFRQKKYGKSTRGIPGEQFVTNIQNHDQVGNRAYGDRFHLLISFNAQKVAAALLLMTPATPLIFMGQEYGETNPFQYFVDHGDAQLAKNVWEGRKAEFQSFGWTDIPNPQDQKAFQKSKLNWKLIDRGKHSQLLCLYQDLIRLRGKIPELARLNRKGLRVYVNEEAGWLAIEYPFGVPGAGVGVVVSVSKKEQVLRLPFRACGHFSVLLDTEDEKYGGKLKCEFRSISKDVTLAPEQAVVGKIQ